MENRKQREGLIALFVSIILVVSLLTITIVNNLKSSDSKLFFLFTFVSAILAVVNFKNEKKYYGYSSVIIMLGCILLIVYNAI